MRHSWLSSVKARPAPWRVAAAFASALLIADAGLAAPLTLSGFVDAAGSGVVELESVAAVALSPDGRHLYAVDGTAHDALAVFRRSGATGELAFVGAESDGANGVDGLANPQSVTVSPDGRHVYVAGLFDDAIAIFGRDATSGAVTFIATVRDGVAGVDGLHFVSDVRVSPDGKHLYATGGEGDVAVFSRNATTGALGFVEAEAMPAGSGSAVALAPDGRHLYVTSIDGNAVFAYARDGATGALALVDTESDGVGGVDGLAFASDVAVSGDGTHVYAVGSQDNEIAVFTRDTATGALVFVEAQTGCVHPYAVAVSPDDATVACLHAGGVDLYQRDAGTGALDPLVGVDGMVDGIDRLFGGTSLAWSPDGRQLYASASLADAIVFLTPPTLTFLGSKTDGVGGADGLSGAHGAAVSPDGAHVYVAAQNEAAVGAWLVESEEGPLALIEVERETMGGAQRLAGAAAVAVAPDGAHLYVAAFIDDAVTIYARNAATGALTYIGAVADGVAGADGLDGAGDLEASPDGAYLYVAGSIENAMAVYARNAATGALTLVEVERDGVGGVDGLERVSASSLSPDGRQLYVTGRFDDAVSVFTRDAATGKLTWLETHRDGLAGVDGLAGAADVVASRDGRHVYVAGADDSAIAIFARDPATGALTFVERLADGIATTDGIGGIAALAIQPSGRTLVAAGSADDAVASFARDPITGHLALVQVERNGFDGVTGLDAPSGIALDPLGRYTAATAIGSDSLALFAPEPTSGPAAAAALFGLAALGRRRMLDTHSGGSIAGAPHSRCDEGRPSRGTLRALCSRAARAGRGALGQHRR